MSEVAAPNAPVQRPPDSAPSAAIRIEIDREIPGHRMHGRCDWLIRGRIISAAPAEDVTLLVDGATEGRIAYGRAGDHAAPSLPGGRHVAIFHFHLSRPSDLPAGGCSLALAATTRDGAALQEGFVLTADPAHPDVALVAAGPVHPMGGPDAARPPIVLYVERAARDATGRLLVQGWAVSFAPMLAIQVHAADTPLGTPRLNAPRADVAAVLPMYPNAGTSGFVLSLERIPEEVTDIRVQAICRTGFSHELTRSLERVAFLPRPEPHKEERPPAAAAAPTLLDERRKIHFHWDFVALSEAGELWLEGWAVCAIGLLGVAVEIDGVRVGEAELGRLRTDVGEQHPDIPFARLSGFRLRETLADLAPGQHAVRIIVRNGLDDLAEETRTVAAASGGLLPESAESTDREDDEFRFQLDHPAVVAGSVIGPVTGRMTIEGWALARSGIAAIDVTLDGQMLGDAHLGLPRLDVGGAYPDWENALRSGYAYHCAPRALRNGVHAVELNVRARNGKVLVQRFNITVEKADEADHAAVRRRISGVEADTCTEVLDGFGYHPTFHLGLRLASPADAPQVGRTLESLREQVYRAWRATLLVGDAEAAEAVGAVLAEFPEIAAQVEVVRIAEAPNGRPLGPDTDDRADLVGCLLPGDELGCDALLELALAGAMHPEAELIYADEQRISPTSRESEPFFKPDFSPDLLLSTNYIGRPWVATSALLRRCAITLRAWWDHGEYDVILQLTEAIAKVRHIPKLLCQSGAEPPDVQGLEAAALARAAARRGIGAEVLAGCAPGIWRFRRTAPVTGKVSIIIPTCAAHGYIETCINSLRAQTAYRDFEIICIDNIPPEEAHWKAWLQENADKVVAIPGAFNWSRFNNLAAEAADGEYLLFLNDDIEVIEEDWLDAMLEHARRPEVGIVGPQLLYPDRKVQHAGMFLAEPGIARHAFRFAAEDEPGYFGLALTQRNVIAVTGACMLVRRAEFHALGRFDETHEVVNNDVDFCLRAFKAGRLTVFTPYAKLIHYELASRDRLPDTYDRGYFQRQWKTLYAAGDPYFNPHLSRHSDDFRPDDEPVQSVFSGHLFRASDIKRLLVVKLDHIGDFVTALPAIRRLKRIFPAASIHLLASPAARALAAAEPEIDEFIGFQFFHTRSELGPVNLTAADLRALQTRLAAYKFDIALDLRKHFDTREILRYTASRFLAGFDHMGRFPFLDIALEWEGDKLLQRKRSHVSTDLVSLVEAVGAAGDGQHNRLTLGSDIKRDGLELLPKDVRRLFLKPVVAVHPAVGTIMRQWPAEHFAALIDLLIEKNGVNAVLIGGPDEVEVGEAVLSQILNRDSVASLMGRTQLADLPALLALCALYVGNNSGPKHIAAALGVPTVGIHSGVVDAIEWGPLGRSAVALRREMNCSPCYLARAEDCPRDLACLRHLEPNMVYPVAEMLLRRVPQIAMQEAQVKRPRRQRAPARRRGSVS